MKDISFFKKGEGSQILLGLRRPTTSLISGIDKLCQETLITLLITPNYDAFDPDRGGGIRAIGGIDKERVKSIIESIISKTETDVKNSQRGAGLVDSERLNNIVLVKTEPLANNSLRIKLRIITEDQQKAFLSFSI